MSYVVIVDGLKEDKVYNKLHDAAMRVKALKNDYDAYFKHDDIKNTIPEDIDNDDEWTCNYCNCVNKKIDVSCNDCNEPKWE